MTPSQRYAILLAAYEQYRTELIADLAVQDDAQRVRIVAAIRAVDEGVGMWRDRVMEYQWNGHSKQN